MPSHDPSSTPATELLRAGVERVDWAGIGVESDWRPAGHGAQCVEFWTEHSVVQIVAWDHAYCLDVEILDARTSHGTYLCFGPCDTAQKFQATLNEALRHITVRLVRERRKS